MKFETNYNTRNPSIQIITTNLNNGREVLGKLSYSEFLGYERIVPVTYQHRARAHKKASVLYKAGYLYAFVYRIGNRGPFYIAIG
jgi:hypothetical protein